jgi:hypothetical protein
MSRMPKAALSEMIRVFSEGFDITGEFSGKEALIDIDHCPIRAVCLERELPIDGPHLFNVSLLYSWNYGRAYR